MRVLRAIKRFFVTFHDGLFPLVPYGEYQEQEDWDNPDISV